MGKQFFKFCDKCKHRFSPIGKYDKLCMTCRGKVNRAFKNEGLGGYGKRPKQDGKS